MYEAFNTSNTSSNSIQLLFEASEVKDDLGSHEVSKFHPNREREDNLYKVFLGGGAAQLVSQLGAREAHQLRVGGIVRTAGPDPFGNGMPLPAYH